MAKFSVTELTHEVEYRKCAADPVYFAANYWFIAHPEGRRLFEMRSEQKETMGALLTEKKIIILKARQIGYSTLCTFFAFWAAFFHQDRQILFISRKEDLAFDLLEMVIFGYNNLPNWLKTHRYKRVNNNKTEMVFDNGSKIVSDAVASDPGRGSTAWLVVMDEAASIPNCDDAWASLGPTIDIGGRIVVLSTAKGTGNWFHKQWLQANEPSSVWKHLFYPWSAVPERDEAWYEEQVREYAHMPWYVPQEFPSNPEEAFLKSGNNFFNVEHLMTLLPEEPDRGVLVRAL